MYMNNFHKFFQFVSFELGFYNFIENCYLFAENFDHIAFVVGFDHFVAGVDHNTDADYFAGNLDFFFLIQIDFRYI